MVGGKNYLSLRIVNDVLTLTVTSGLLLAGILVLSIWIKNRAQKISYLRFYVQAVAFFAIFSTVIVLARWNWLVIAVVVFVLPPFIGRFFCGWLCPFGFYMDLISLLRRALKIRYWNLPDKLNKMLHKLRYLIVSSLLLLPFSVDALSVQVWSALFLFQAPFRQLNSFFIGPLETIITPFPGTLELGDYSLTYPYIRGIIAYLNVGELTTVVVVAFIVLTVLSAFVFRRFWCRFCPTGISIAAVNRFKSFRGIPLMRLNKVEEKCTKCGICKRVCSVQVTDVYEQKGGDVPTQMCVLCLRCVEMCPYEDCLRVKVAGRVLVKSRNWLEQADAQ